MNEFEDALNKARQVLGVGPNVTTRQLRRAFRKRAKETHPDRQGRSSEFELVKASYALLLEHSEQFAPGWLLDEPTAETDVRVAEERKPVKRHSFGNLLQHEIRRQNRR